MQDKSNTTGASKLPGSSATGNTSPRPKKAVLIIGGGIGGCMAAWKAAENGWDVTLLEKASDLFSGSSGKTPGRMGLGFHYSDVETAKRLLRATINFVKEFPGFERGKDKPANHPVKNGRYYVVKESLVDVERITDTYFELVNYYKNLVKEDSRNKIYGDPKRFLRVLEEQQYAEIINNDIVAEAYETCEPLLDWEYFREFFVGKLTQHQNIKIILNAAVTKAEYLDNGDYKLYYTEGVFSEGAKETSCISPYVINCTWQNSESLDAQLGFVPDDHLNRVNRLKVIATVELPSELQMMHSAFFLTGAHCMVTNKFDTTADMSYAEVTNVVNFRGLIIDNTWAALLEGKYNNVDIDIVMPDIKRYIAGEPMKVPFPEELKVYLQKPQEQWNPKEMLDIYYGCRIRDGVAKYVPKMAQAKVNAVKFGIVKTRGDNVDIHDPNSDIHKRNYSGVTERQLGWITNDCMKLLYSVDNANEVLGLLNKHYYIDCAILSRVYKTLQRYQHDSVKMQGKIDTLRYAERLNYLGNPRAINPGEDERIYSAHSSATSRSTSVSNSESTSSGVSPVGISPREGNAVVVPESNLVSKLRKSPTSACIMSRGKNYQPDEEDAQDTVVSTTFPPPTTRFYKSSSSPGFFGARSHEQPDTHRKLSYASVESRAFNKLAKPQLGPCDDLMLLSEAEELSSSHSCGETINP